MSHLRRFFEPHDETDDCRDHCHSHGVDEPGPGHLGCGECGHLYRTARALWWANVRAAWSPYADALHRTLIALVTPPGRIYTCAHCGHDL